MKKKKKIKKETFSDAPAYFTKKKRSVYENDKHILMLEISVGRKISYSLYGVGYYSPFVRI